jgi:hypothetical protein
VQYQHQPLHAVRIGHQRRHVEFHRALAGAVDGYQDGTPAHRDAAARAQCNTHRISERSPIGFVDQRCHIGKTFADDIGGALTQEHLGRVIDIVDATFGIDGDDALAHGIEGGRRPRYDSRCSCGGFGQHFQCREQQRGLAGTVDHRARKLHARGLATLTEQFDFVTLGGGFTGHAPAKVIDYQVDIFRCNEFAQWFPHHVVGALAEQVEESRVGEQHVRAMHENGVVHGFDQALKELFATVEVRAALLEVLQQFVDGGTQLLERLRLALENDSSGGA